MFQHFLEWNALVGKSSGHQVKVLCTNNGREYTSTQFEDFLKSEGIRHEHTVPKTSEQNGVAECLNRTLMETVRSMLIDTKLPHQFWAEALSTAVYLKNHSPKKAIDSVTPCEAWRSTNSTGGKRSLQKRKEKNITTGCLPGHGHRRSQKLLI